jgi:hypothetical protein
MLELIVHRSVIHATTEPLCPSSPLNGLPSGETFSELAAKEHI